MAAPTSERPTPRSSVRSALTAKALRKGLLALQAGQSLDPLQRALRPLARRLVGPLGSDDDVETLVSDFTTATVGDAGQRQLAALLSLPDGQLPAAARRWLLQLNAQRLPHWNLLRTPRRHVRTALGELHLADSNGSPARLQTPDGDWNYPAVRAAMARLLKANRALARDPNRVAEELFRQHGPRAELPLEAPEAAIVPADGMNPEERYHLFVDADRLMGLIQLGGHQRRGRYGVQNGWREEAEAGPSQFHGRVQGGGGEAGADRAPDGRSGGAGAGPDRDRGAGLGAAAQGRPGQGPARSADVGRAGGFGPPAQGEPRAQGGP